MEGKEKLNILIFSWRGPGHPNAGGAEISTHEHAKGWVKAGNSVTLFTSTYKGAKEEEWIDEVKIVRAGSQTLGIHLEAFKWYIFNDHPKFDLIIDQFHGIPFFTPIYVRAKKLAFIHETAKEVWKLNEFTFPLNMLVGILGSIFEPLIFRLYKKISFMTVSKSTKDDLVLWGIPENNINIILNGVTIPKLKIKKNDKKTIVYLGALAKDKGIETALLSFSFIKKTLGEDVQFWIIGKSDPEYLNLLKTKAKDLELEKVRFWGYVDEIKKYNLLSNSHILINPSVKEGWGIVVIEAAAMGTPTIAFNVAGLKDSIRDGKTGFLCTEMTAESLAKKAIELLNDKKKLEQISKNAILWSRNFSWDKSVNLSLKLIKRLAG